MKSRLEELRRQRFVGVAELAAVAARVLAERGPVQARGTVSELPDERTVRYYLTEGLIAPAEEKQGTASVFGYLHLLQLLAVKHLQAEHLPIRKIRELVEGRSERELERLLGLDARATDKNAALSYLESLLTQTRPAHNIPPPAATAQSFGARQRGDASSAPLSAPSPAPPAAATWERIEIEPGLELHISSAYRPPLEAKGLRRLAAAFVHAVGSYGRQLIGKRGK
jgi:DNA-binding transcriptional MerR regulator